MKPLLLACVALVVVLVLGFFVEGLPSSWNIGTIVGIPVGIFLGSLLVELKKN